MIADRRTVMEAVDGLMTEFVTHTGTLGVHSCSELQVTCWEPCNISKVGWEDTFQRCCIAKCAINFLVLYRQKTVAVVSEPGK